MLKSSLQRLKARLGLINARPSPGAAPRAEPPARVQEERPVEPRKRLEHIYLHIGSHKTGTSAIQLFLQKNARTLAERLDLAVLSPHPWPLQFNADEARMDFRTDGFKMLGVTTTKKVLLTHECYSWLDSPDDLAALHGALSAYAPRVTVILYLRRQDAMAVSMKQEGTKWIDCATAYGHELKALPTSLTPLAETYLRHDEKVARCAAAFGKENLEIRLFERSRLKNGDAIEDFMEILGEPDLAAYKSVGEVNTSLTRTQQLFLHQTRGQFPEQTRSKHLLVEIVRSMDLGDREKLLPSLSEAKAFYEQFRAGNARLNREFQLSESAFLFSEDFSAYPETDNAAPLSEAELLSIFEKVMGELSYRLEGLRPNDQIERTANWLRTQALKRESDDVALALLLMQQAHRLKPAGPFIKRKIAEYERALEKE